MTLARPVTITPDQLPQTWRDVISPPVDVVEATGRHLATLGAGVLAEQELAELVRRVAADPGIWGPLAITDPHRRRYRLAYEDERLDLWVLSWMDGHATGFHDHGASAVALTAVQGSVLERHLVFGSATPSERVLAPGEVHSGGVGYVHAVGHHAGAPALTIHAYSPPLGEVGQYRATEDGRMWREPQHGRQELLDHSIDAVVEAG